MPACFTSARVTDLGSMPHVNLGCDQALLGRFAPLKHRFFSAHHSPMMKTIGGDVYDGLDSELTSGDGSWAPTASEWDIPAPTSTISRLLQ